MTPRVRFMAWLLAWAFLCPGASAQEAPSPAATPGPAAMPDPAAMLEQVGAFVRMPGRSHRGPLPALSESQKALAEALRRDVEKLAGEIGERNFRAWDNLEAAAGHIEASFRAAGLEPESHAFEVEGETFRNVEAEIPGSSRAEEILILSAHYDSVFGGPGANDNASGVAAVLALARRMAGSKPERTARFVCFANEEQLDAPTAWGGSIHYARRCRERGENIVGVLNFDTLGCFSDEPGSQKYPQPFAALYPDTADFVAVIGDSGLSKEFVFEAAGAFRRLQAFPCEGLAAPRAIRDIGRSDERSFWDEGYPGAMVTDTANFRSTDYHRPTDTPEKIDYARMARVVEGFGKVAAEMASPGPGPSPEASGTAPEPE